MIEVQRLATRRAARNTNGSASPCGQTRQQREPHDIGAKGECAQPDLIDLLHRNAVMVLEAAKQLEKGRRRLASLNGGGRLDLSTSECRSAVLVTYCCAAALLWHVVVWCYQTNRTLCLEL